MGERYISAKIRRVFHVKDSKIRGGIGIIGIETKGINGVAQALHGLGKNAVKAFRKSYNQSLRQIKSEVRKEAPVRFGPLKESVRILSNETGSGGDNWTATIGPDGSAVNSQGESYALFVIFGTSRMRANNFLARGYQNAIPKVKRTSLSGMRKELTKIIRSKGRVRIEVNEIKKETERAGRSLGVVGKAARFIARLRSR